MTSLTLSAIEKTLGGQPILRGIELRVKDGELVVLVGPSGCGKSTLLRTVAGLELPDAGTIRIGDRDVTQLPPRDRDVGMVFQSYALYPHLTVRENLGFGLMLRKSARTLIEERVREVSSMLGLELLLDRYPKDMSGGQRQRVAMGRAIARRPSLFLFDEPLSNLDAALRAEVRVEIKRLHGRLGATMLYVTHDQVEAMTLADTLVVLNKGRVEQMGPPLEIYEKPRTRFVGTFLGSPSMNMLSVAHEGETLRGEGVRVRARHVRSSAEVDLGVRPHDLRVVAAEDAELTMQVDVIEAMGFEAYAHGKVGSTPFIARLEGAALSGIRAGTTLHFAITQAHLFDQATGLRLPEDDVA